MNPDEIVTPEKELNIVDDNTGEQVVDNTQPNLEVNAVVDENIVFEEGSLDDMLQLSSNIATKHSFVMRTFLPIVEVALIELYGNSNMFKRLSLEHEFNPQTLSLSIKVTYLVNAIIGLDVDVNLIAEDANYILNRINPIVGQTGNITECRVDCQTGNIIIGLNC
jgi:hypothetical protein